MTLAQFRAITLDISNKLEGDSCELEVRLSDGAVYRGTWWEPPAEETIAMDIGDEPPVYIDCASIVSVQVIS